MECLLGNTSTKLCGGGIVTKEELFRDVVAYFIENINNTRLSEGLVYEHFAKLLNPKIEDENVLVSTGFCYSPPRLSDEN